MTPERWERLKAVFLQAIDQPAEERRAWIARTCGDDLDLKREAEGLLAAHDDPGFLEESAQFDPEDVVAAVNLLDPGAPLAPGTILGNSEYRIVGELGRGGMGIVYVAEDLRLRRRVALKSLPAQGNRSPGWMERLRREALAAARISHPNVAMIIAFQIFDERPWIVSEYVSGATLRSEVERGPLEAGQAHRIAIDIARALCAAHEAGVIHRDLKPENVVLTEDGFAKVVDFGIADIESPDLNPLTIYGGLMGTLAYMAPEQLQMPGAADARADIYSFGVVAREMLTGRHPMRVTSPAASKPKPWAEHARGLVPVSQGPSPKPNAGSPLWPIVQRCTQYDPDARYASARDLLRDLEAAVAPPTPLPPLDDAARWWWRFHQVATAAIYWMMVGAAWSARDELRGAFPGERGSFVAGLFFVTVLASVIVSANLRLNLWFQSRFLPAQLATARHRLGRWIRAGDWVLVVALLSAGLLILEEKPYWSLLFLGVGIGAAVAASLIEPVTTRAAFNSPPSAEP